MDFFTVLIVTLSLSIGRAQAIKVRIVIHGVNLGVGHGEPAKWTHAVIASPLK